MIFSNVIYYAIGIPLAFILHDRRAFCKYVCPVALVMKPASYISVIKIKADQEKECIECGACNNICPMGVDVMSYMKDKKPIRDTECILCSDCKIVCPTKIIV
jgi:polyferredoxin